MNNPEVRKIRDSIYLKDGYYVIPNFVSDDDLRTIQEAWTSDIAYEFSIIPNKEVSIGSPAYVYNRPSQKILLYSYMERSIG